MKLSVRIISLLLTVVLLMGVLAGCASFDTPLNELKKALKQTIYERFGGEFASTLLEAMNGGLIEMRFDGADPELFETSVKAADLKLWMNADAKTLAAAGAMTVGDKSYDGQLFLDQDELIFSSDAVLGSYDLGIDFQTLSEDLKNSIFRNNSGSEYSVPWLGNRGAEHILTLQDSFFTVLGNIKDWYYLLDELADIFLEALAENVAGDFYSKDGNVVIDVKVNNGILSRTLRDVHEVVVNDGDFCRELRRIAATRDAALTAQQGNGTKVTEWTNFAESLIQGRGIVDGWCNYIDNDMAPFEIKLQAVIDGIIEEAELTVSVAPDHSTDQYAHVLTLGLDLTADDTNKLYLVKGGQTRTLTYTVVEDGLSVYKSKIVYQRVDDTTGASLEHAVGELCADRSTDRYELSWVNNTESGAQTRCFFGSFDKKIDGYTFSIDSAMVNGSPKKLSFALNVDVDSTPPEAPRDYKKLFNLSHVEFTPIYKRASSALQEIKANWRKEDLLPDAWLDQFFSALALSERISP